MARSLMDRDVARRFGAGYDAKNPERSTIRRAGRLGGLVLECFLIMLPVQLSQHVIAYADQEPIGGTIPDGQWSQVGLHVCLRKAVVFIVPQKRDTAALQCILNGGFCSNGIADVARHKPRLVVIVEVIANFVPASIRMDQIPCPDRLGRSRQTLNEPRNAIDD